MDYDFPELFAVIERVVKRHDGDVHADLQQVVDYCAGTKQHSDWGLFKSLDIGADLERLSSWLGSVCTKEPPPADVDGMWFGIFNPGYDDGRTSADFYVSGGKYDAADPDWCVDPPWWPENRYAGSLVMEQIYEHAYRENGLGNAAEYPLCLAYACLAVRRLALSPDIAWPASPIVLVCGFDSGDSVCIGERSADGIRFSKETERML